MERSGSEETVSKTADRKDKTPSPCPPPPEAQTQHPAAATFLLSFCNLSVKLNSSLERRLLSDTGAATRDITLTSLQEIKVIQRKSKGQRRQIVSVN